MIKKFEEEKKSIDLKKAEETITTNANMKF